MSLDIQEEWKCEACSLRVWRYRLVKEAKVKRVEFPHSIIHPNGGDPRCASGWIVRTGRTREGYVDEVLSPSEMAREHPIFGRAYQDFSRPESVSIMRRREEVLG